MFSRKCAQVHNMFHTVSLGRIDQCFALHEHVNCISSYKKESRDVFQCLIERSWISEIDKARCPTLICEIFQIRFLRVPTEKCASLLLKFFATSFPTCPVTPNTSRLLEVFIWISFVLVSSWDSNLAPAAPEAVIAVTHSFGAAPVEA